MSRPTHSCSSGGPGACRLGALAPLDQGELDALRRAESSARTVPPHGEIVAMGEPICPAMIILSGWAYRNRLFPDGSRQILGLLLPGEMIGNCRQNNPVAVTSVRALTQVGLCPAPDPPRHGAGLAQAYARSGALDDAYSLRQIARLGRMNAQERLADLLLELGDRLSLSGIASPECFPLPMTQEAIADTIGLTSVHVNRTLQALRGEGLIELRAGTATLLDRPRLVDLVDYTPVVAWLPDLPTERSPGSGRFSKAQ